MTVFEPSLPLLSILFLSPLLSSVLAQDESLFTGCDFSDYYGELLSEDAQNWTRSSVETLLQSTHRNMLPYTASGRDDVWDALIDLDQGDTEGTVHLIYKDVDVPAVPYGTGDTWNREHLWPKSRGVEDSGADFVDVHHLRPADWGVNAARGNLFFGECGMFNGTDSQCKVPATGEAAEDTASDGTIFLPPSVSRGDIARAIFYMDVRYSGKDGGKDLVVTDCPSGDQNMAYLSTLLEWHAADPPDDRERLRNDRVCERWQGNRNVFVDYPELAFALFGEPQSFPVACTTLAPSPASVPTMMPTTMAAPSNTTNTMKDCSSLLPGDIMVTLVNSDNPDLVAFVALSGIAGGMQLFATDNAWMGSSFRTNEGTIMVRSSLCML